MLAYGFLYRNSNYLVRSDLVLQQWAASLPVPSEEAFEVLSSQLTTKAARYNHWIESNHLARGMIVNTDPSGHIKDHCDSMLFSSLRLVALRKLGLYPNAHTAWQAIRENIDQGFIKRHPYCAHLGASKDMLIGLMAALTTKPAGHREVVEDLLNTIDQSGGYFSNGPIYLSYATPTVAESIRQVAHDTGIEYQDMPDLVRRGYSTTEIGFSFIDGGYKSHLAALAIWIQLETEGVSLLNQFEIDDGSTLAERVPRQFLSWNTHNLLLLNNGLFNRYLRLRAAGALTPAVRYKLMKELAAMTTQFPDHRLPASCDRKADYLWQRLPDETVRRSHGCSKRFHGTDFLWMTALLTEVPEQETTVQIQSH